MSDPRQLDPTVAKVLDKERPTDEAEDEDALFRELEDDTSALDAFREQRMQQLHEEFEKARYLRGEGHGTYETVANEKAVMDITTKTKLSIVHFAHPDFRRCQIMDRHLRELATKHYEARIIRVEVETAPFLVEKLGVRVLPCVMCFVDGKGVGRIEGFEVLGNTDTFRTSELERQLVALGVLEREKIGEEEGRTRRERDEKYKDNDSGDDWD